MSKGLEALERIGKRKYQTTVANITGFERITISVKQDNKKDYQTIEKELKEYEEMKTIKGTTTFDKAIEDTLINSCPNVAKKLKALEIIKNKEINVHALFLHLKRFDKPDGYNVLVGTKYQITQEEYDLLKEVLL